MDQGVYITDGDGPSLGELPRDVLEKIVADPELDLEQIQALSLRGPFWKETIESRSFWRAMMRQRYPDHVDLSYFTQQRPPMRDPKWQFIAVDAVASARKQAAYAVDFTAYAPNGEVRGWWRLEISPIGDGVDLVAARHTGRIPLSDITEVRRIMESVAQEVDLKRSSISAVVNRTDQWAIEILAYKLLRSGYTYDKRRRPFAQNPRGLQMRSEIPVDAAAAVRQCSYSSCADPAIDQDMIAVLCPQQNEECDAVYCSAQCMEASQHECGAAQVGRRVYRGDYPTRRRGLHMLRNPPNGGRGSSARQRGYFRAITNSWRMGGAMQVGDSQEVSRYYESLEPEAQAVMDSYADADLFDLLLASRSDKRLQPLAEEPYFWDAFAQLRLGFDLVRDWPDAEPTDVPKESLQNLLTQPCNTWRRRFVAVSVLRAVDATEGQLLYNKRTDQIAEFRVASNQEYFVMLRQPDGTYMGNELRSKDAALLSIYAALEAGFAWAASLTRG